MNFKSVFTAILALSWLGLSGCSSAYKQRQVERDRVAQNSGLFCEFVNGDDHNDIDVELNLQMAKKCDLNKQYNFTNYKNASDVFGVVYCCATNKNKTAANSSKAAAHANPTKDNKDVKDKKPSDEVEAE